MRSPVYITLSDPKYRILIFCSSIVCFEFTTYVQQAQTIVKQKIVFKIRYEAIYSGVLNNRDVTTIYFAKKVRPTRSYQSPTRLLIFWHFHKILNSEMKFCCYYFCEIFFFRSGKGRIQRGVEISQISCIFCFKKFQKFFTYIDPTRLFQSTRLF